MLHLSRFADDRNPDICAAKIYRDYVPLVHESSRHTIPTNTLMR
jgi:hypothetical protein